MQDTSFTGPPIQLVMQWIDELWAQECAPVTMSSDSQEEHYEAISEELLPFEQHQDFQLLEPLKTRQRKSYEGESRFLTPRPVIALHPSSPLNNRLKRCTVSVRLLDVHGSPLHCHEQTHLYGPYGKEALLSIPHGRTPPISVKIGGKCDLRALRLGFTVEYETDNGYCGRTHLTSNEVQLARKQCPNKRGTSSHKVSGASLRLCVDCLLNKGDEWKAGGVTDGIGHIDDVEPIQYLYRLEDFHVGGIVTGEATESQKEILSHLDEPSVSECTIGLPLGDLDPAEEGGLKRLAVPANHFLLSTQRNKPTTASQPQQPWNILTWIFIETQNTWAYILFGTSLGYHQEPTSSLPPTVTRSTL
ncbi:hypothetical protein PROFUN_02946 [Planoprotostelium fungivorum]|uniref:Uncharacterized protein n=1 Tax=Planoprotostelium fungivorum TaxID=1890364 RepID=A0A2P6NX46_9EUKA|nr:hypothetical protein PROFUN_02946 [Planoprotostelium fungivorum]